jgi:hypothetical protein
MRQSNPRITLRLNSWLMKLSARALLMRNAPPSLRKAWRAFDVVRRLKITHFAVILRERTLVSALRRTEHFTHAKF